MNFKKGAWCSVGIHSFSGKHLRQLP